MVNLVPSEEDASHLVSRMRKGMHAAQNFDPLNVQRLSPSYVLHARALTVGNAAGKLDLFGLAAITEAAGAHPLFQGIKRVVVTGPVEAVEKDGAVELHAPGLQGRFTGATLAREGERTLVRLP